MTADTDRDHRRAADMFYDALPLFVTELPQADCFRTIITPQNAKYRSTYG
jgi:hypothetical protein